MAKENSTSYQEALEQLPKYPYELPYLWYQLLTVGLAYGSSHFYEEINQNQQFIPGHIIAALVCIGGLIADRYSTIQAFDAMNEAIDQGVRTYSTEANTLVGNIHTSQEFKNNNIVKALDTGAVIVGTINPGIGIAIGFSKGIAYLNNMRVAKRMNLSAEIAKNKSVNLSRRVTGRNRIK